MIKQLFLSLLEVSVSASIIIIAVALFSGILNKRYAAKWKYWLWIALTIRLLIPINFNFSFRQIDLNIPDVVLSDSSSSSDNSNLLEDSTDGIPVEWSRSATGGNISLLQVLCTLWLSGAAVFFVVNIVIYLNIYRRLMKQGSRMKDTEVLLKIKELSDDMKIHKQVIALICPSVYSPMILGYRRPLLILPEYSYTSDELTYILKHELTHLRRRDNYYKLLLLMANSLHWFNPAVHLMMKEANKDLELSCDTEVVKQATFQQRKEYSETIYATIQKQCSRNTVLSTQFYGGNKIMKQRFENILGRQKKRNGLCMVVVVIALTLVSGSLIACSNSDSSNSSNAVHDSSKDNVKVTPEVQDVKETEEGKESKEAVETTSAQELSADAIEIQKIMEEFSKAYFEADVEGMELYLADSYERPIDTYSETGEKVIVTDTTIKGLNDIAEKDINDVIEVWFEFRYPIEADSYQYLTLEMIKLEEGWKISSYGIEG